MAFEYDGEFGANEAYYEPNRKGFSRYDIDQERKRFAERDKRDKKIIAFVLAASLLIACMLVIHDKCIKKQQDKQKIESLNNTLLNGSDVLNQKQR